MISNDLKRVARATFPRSFQRVEEALTRRRLKRVETQLIRDHGLNIQSGPFTGMAYVSEAVCSSLVPKLIGSYEAELNETLAILFKKTFKRIVDIGCAEGYYAVGLAMRFPEAQVYAFDIDARARELCRQLALANTVGDRLSIESECNHERLRELTTQRTLIVSDCEGCELELLQPDLVPGFRNCDLVVELHDMVTAGITETILNRFSDSHEITLINSETRDASQYPAIKHYPAAVRATAVAEFRDTRMQWAHMSAKAT